MQTTRYVPPALAAIVYAAGFGGGLGCDLDDDAEIAFTLGESGKVIELTPPPQDAEEEQAAPAAAESTTNG